MILFNEMNNNGGSMKQSILRFALQLIILTLTANIIFSVDGESEEDILSKLGAHIPELQLMPVEQGIKSELNSDSDPVKAIINAFKYLNNITSTSKFWYAHKATLIEMLKKLAAEKFVPEYAGLSQEELNQKLDRAMFNLGKSMSLFMGNINEVDAIKEKIAGNESPERNEIVKLIIAGANPNFARARAYPPLGAIQGLLEVIIGFEDVNLVQLLIAYGANVNQKDPYGIYPLDYAVIGYHNHLNMEKAKKIIELLIKAGANVNQKDKNGLNIAIYRATEEKNLPLLEVLLQNGAKLDEVEINTIKDIDNYWADRYNKIVNILKKYGYNI